MISDDPGTLADMETFGNRLGTALTQMQVSRGKLAKHLGVTEQAISQAIHSPKGTMNAPNALLTALFLGVEPEWLILGRGSMHAVHVTASEPLVDWSAPANPAPDLPQLLMKADFSPTNLTAVTVAFARWFDRMDPIKQELTRGLMTSLMSKDAGTDRVAYAMHIGALYNVESPGGGAAGGSTLRHLMRPRETMVETRPATLEHPASPKRRK